MTAFRPFFNAATSEWIEFTATAEDTDGQLVRFNWRSMPGGVITEHVHPHQEERFIITAGEAHFTLDGEELLARSGETIVVPAGNLTAHPGAEHRAAAIVGAGQGPRRAPLLPALGQPHLVTRWDVRRGTASHSHAPKYFP